MKNETEMRSDCNTSDHFPETTKMVPLTLNKNAYFPIPDTSDMTPLTLEQYNALDGRPVIVEKNTMKKWWEIAHSLSGDTCGYGRFWWAYAYPTSMTQNATKMRPSRNTPLTLEQLREKINEPVYLYIYDTALDSGWHIIKAVTEDKIIFRGWNTVYVPISSIGKCFDLYAYPPARIDREAWTAEWKGHYKSGASAGTGYVCSSCDMWNGRKSHICPSCGKAMDEDGLAMLEKRLMG